MNFMEVMIHRLFKGDLGWGLLTPVLGHQVLFARLSAAGRQVKVTPALTDSETATKILESESAWELVLEETAVRIVDTDSPDVSDRGSSPPTVPPRISPIVLLREYPDHGLDRFDLSEEFRLYHDLSEDTERGVLVDFDRSGGESVVATVGAEYVTVRKKHLMQFLAGTGRHLVLFVDITDREKMPGDEQTGIRPVDEVSDVCKKRDSWHDASSAKGNARRLLRKVVFSPPPGENAGIWPRMPAKETIPFVIGCDAIGNDVEDVSPPGKRRIVEPMAPVFFLDAVLDKYRSSERYRVSSRDLTCQERWWCPMIVQHDVGLVMVYYDDLRSRIPPKEQLHWRQYNIATNETDAYMFHDADLGGMAPSNPRLHQRQYSIEGLETGPQEDSAVILEKLLKDIPPTYRRFNSWWKDTEGWPFFKEQNDQPLLDRITVIPRDRGQAVLWVIDLNGLLVEGLTESKMKEAIKRPKQPSRLWVAVLAYLILGASLPHREKSAKASAVIESYLAHRGFPHADLVARFIRDLSDVRAVHTHRENKGHETIKERTGIDLGKDPTGGCRILAHKGLNMLNLLEEHFIPNREEEDH